MSYCQGCADRERDLAAARARLDELEIAASVLLAAADAVVSRYSASGSTHYEGCEANHPSCALAMAADKARAALSPGDNAAGS